MSSVRSSAHVWSAAWLDVLARLRSIDDPAELEATLNRLATPGRPLTVAFVNAHVMNLVADDRELLASLRACDLLLRDGIGVAILMRLMGRKPGFNLNGTDLIPRLLELACGARIALLGTRAPWNEKAATAIARRHRIAPEDILLLDGFQSDKRYVEACLEHVPRFVVLGMGVPKQERVARRLRRELSHPCLIMCGGAIIDFYGERVHRAPLVWRRLNLEWLYRLGLEPRRLFKRYVLGSPVFLLRAVWLRLVSGALRSSRKVGPPEPVAPRRRPLQRHLEAGQASASGSLREALATDPRAVTPQPLTVGIDARTNPLSKP